MNPVIPAILLIRVTSNRRVFPMFPSDTLWHGNCVHWQARGDVYADTRIRPAVPLPPSTNGASDLAQAAQL